MLCVPLGSLLGGGRAVDLIGFWRVLDCFQLHPQTVRCSGHVEPPAAAAAPVCAGSGRSRDKNALFLVLTMPLPLNLASTLLKVSSLSLPLAKLVAVYEQLVLELLEMRELDVARYVARLQIIAVFLEYACSIKGMIGV